MNILSRALACSVMLLLAGAARSAQANAERNTRLVVARSAVVLTSGSAARADRVSEATHVGLWGFIGGTLLGTGAGYAMGRSMCDGIPRGSCVRNSTIGGAIVGGLVGYGLERLFRWQ